MKTLLLLATAFHFYSVSIYRKTNLELAQIIPVPEKSSDAGKPRQLVTLILGYDTASVPLQNTPTDSGEKKKHSTLLR